MPMNLNVGAQTQSLNWEGPCANNILNIPNILS